jgi:ketosteroid isomerase-like protein
LETFEAGGVEAALPHFHPDFVGRVPPELSAEPDHYRGADGVRRWFAGFEGSLDDVRIEPLDLIEVGDSVLMPSRLTGRGSESGIEVEQAVVQLWRFRDGLVVRIEAFPDLDSARGAAGEAP